MRQNEVKTQTLLLMGQEYYSCQLRPKSKKSYVLISYTPIQNAFGIKNNTIKNFKKPTFTENYY